MSTYQSTDETYDPSLYPPTIPPTADGGEVNLEAELNTLPCEDDAALGAADDLADDEPEATYELVVPAEASLDSDTETFSAFGQGSDEPEDGLDDAIDSEEWAAEAVVAEATAFSAGISATAGGVTQPYKLTNQILSGTAITAHPFNGAVRLCVQDVNNVVREFVNRSSGPNFLVAFEPRRATPLASISWTVRNPGTSSWHLGVRVYSVDNQNILRESAQGPNNIWASFTQDRLRVNAGSESKLASVFVPGAIHLYYQLPDRRIQYVQCLQSNQWRWIRGVNIPNIPNIPRGTSIAAVAWGNLNVRLFYLNNQNQIVHSNFVGTIGGEGRWAGQVLGVTARANSPLAATYLTDNQNHTHVRLYYLNQNNIIQELAWDGSNFTTGTLNARQVAAAPNSSLAATTFNNRTILLYYQAPGDGATFHLQHRTPPNSWMTGPILTPRAS